MAAGRPARRHWGSTPPRANLLLAVLACRTAVEIPASAQMFAAAVGGITVTEPAADLAVALAMASVITDVPVPPDVVVFGELGLAGEVRTVPGADRRLAEAHRAGFTRALVPASMASAPVVAPPGLTVHGVRTLAEALSLVRSEADARVAPGTMPGWPTVPAAASL